MFWSAFLLAALPALPPNQWVELARDPSGARRGSAIRYAPDAGAFFLWGFQNDNPDLPQEQPLMEVSEYDIVAFDPDERRWRNHLPPQRESEWSKRLPLAYIPRTYAGITTGSERTVMRGPTGDAGGVPRPDLNLVFDQVTYHPPSRSLLYFTGGLTAAYDVGARRWRDLAPSSPPPPVVGGSLAWDPVNEQVVLFGGGHVAEQEAGARIVGYIGTWFYRHRDSQWRPWPLLAQPPPRMNTRLVCDTRRKVMVLFGGDGQSRYLGDTWLLDLQSLTWRRSTAAGPAPRAGHFTVYDPETGWVILGGGYNHEDLTDMWAYDAGEDRWRRLAGEVPTGFYLSADLAPEKRLLVLVTATRRPGDTRSCNVLYPVRTTYGYRIEKETIVTAEAPASAPEAVSKRAPQTGEEVEAARQELRFPNQWVRLADGAMSAPMRSWGSATLDGSRGLILYWGGGHCGYEGNDVDAFDVEKQRWRAPTAGAEYPERNWDRGARLAGVTFDGGPWTEHGRKIYAHDPPSQKMILVRGIRLTASYEPSGLRGFPARTAAAPDAAASQPSSYVKYGTWSYDPDTGKWELLGPAPAGLDTLASTRHGVVGVTVDWPSRLNDAGYQLPYHSSGPPQDTAVYLFDASGRSWKRLGEPQSSPQNLYEMTALAYDSTRDQLILHGAGPTRDELWTFEMASRRWRNMHPAGDPPPAAAREGVYIPREEVFLVYGPAPEDRATPAMWAYHAAQNSWTRVDLSPVAGIDPRLRAGQNRAMVYDAERDLVLLILSEGGDRGRAAVFAMRYRHAGARRFAR